MTTDKITITCQWCGGEFKMLKSDLSGTMDTGIQMCFEHPFAVFSGRKQLTGEITIKVSPLECDICEACSLAIISGSIEEMCMSRNVNPNTFKRIKDGKES